MIRCSSCGYENGPGVDACIRCGSALQMGSKQSAPVDLGRFCPNCRESNPASARFCGFCGRAFPDLTTGEPILAGANVVCLHCGVENAPGVHFCSNCGMAMSVNMPLRPLPGPVYLPARQSVSKGLGCGLALSLVLGFVLLLLFAGITIAIYILYFASPPASYSPTATTVPIVTNTLAPTIAFIPSFSYTVAPGDTCDGIAAAFGVSSQSIISLNNLDPACATLTAGQVIRIPYGSSSPVLQQPTMPPPTVADFPPTGLPPGPPTFTAEKNALCRTGPSQTYAVATSINQGVGVPIIGRSAPGWEDWWQVSMGGVKCWVWSGLGTASGDLNAVPIVQAPSTPNATKEIVTTTPWATETPICGPKPPGGAGNCTQVYIAWCNCMGGSYSCGFGGPICVLP